MAMSRVVYERFGHIYALEFFKQHRRYDLSASAFFDAEGVSAYWNSPGMIGVGPFSLCVELVIEARMQMLACRLSLAC